MKTQSTRLRETAVETLIYTANEWTRLFKNCCTTTLDRATEILKTVLDRGEVGTYDRMENRK